MAEPRRPTCDHECSPRDSIDALLASWGKRRPDLDFSPVAVISRLARVRAHIGTELEVVFREFGLSQSDFEALVTLARIGEDHGVSQRRLADELGLSPGTVSVRIDRLVDRGLVTRAPDPESKRNALIALTDEGRDVFERAAPAHLANEQRLLASLTDKERQLLADLLRKLLVEFEGSQPTSDGDRIGIVVSPAHVTIGMRAAVGLSRDAGLLVRAVDPGSPAARADLRPGDVLIKAGSRELRSSASLYAAAREAEHGRVAITLLRGSDRIRAKLVLSPGCFTTGRSATTGEPRRQAEHTI